VLHPGRANVSKSDLADELVKSHKCKKENVIMFGFRTQFGTLLWDYYSLKGSQLTLDCHYLRWRQEYRFLLDL
jgi:hypothetical protein